MCETKTISQKVSSMAYECGQCSLIRDLPSMISQKRKNIKKKLTPQEKSFFNWHKCVQKLMEYSEFKILKSKAVNDLLKARELLLALTSEILYSYPEATFLREPSSILFPMVTSSLWYIQREYENSKVYAKPENNAVHEAGQMQE
jgi:hypothetical protein